MSNFGNCWLSPDGEVVLSNNHDKKAWNIIKERFGLSPSDVKEPSLFLGAHGWIAFHDRPWWFGWWISNNCREPTQAQIDRVYELTKFVYDDSKHEFVRK